MKTTVRDVMTGEVATVTRDTSFHDAVAKLVETGVSGLPVVDADGRVSGVISETDLLCKEEYRERYFGEYYSPPIRARLRHRLGSQRDSAGKAEAETVNDLMTAPAIVTTPDSPVVLAARLMDRHGVKRLPVVDADGLLVGIVTRHDLIKVFLQDDSEITLLLAQEATLTQVMDRKVTVTDGVVTIEGRTEVRSQANAAVRAAERLDGVVAVHSRVTWSQDDTFPVTAWGGA
ncbi:CBS domain-containing protein [Spongiactinospora sp. TRM90649]|uniref:CBS domain-containing protein n=1 Tax=Spongiactinospora sp. TRM90649 TaxID=3031114 RepID=UPI0023F6C0A4|nr:CBS domain-containing protein [Spongiactinospora sp. TRM90649]MDF5755224.1 CBS domain-containing protein [Spongiactinospora sp. TRM90649]